MLAACCLWDLILFDQVETKMPIRLVLPQTTSALSMANPTPSLSEVTGNAVNSSFNTFVYSPFDFSEATLYDYTVQPLVDGIDVIAPMMCVFFAAQVLGWYLLRFLFPKRFLSMAAKEQRDLSIRVVAIVNGLICLRSAVAFFSITHEHGNTLHNFHFQPENDKYRFSRLSIVAYFAWDLIVCVYFRWGGLWIAHAMASLVGVFGMASIPLSDHLGGYYSGVFELSNGLIHVAFLLRCMESCIPLATVLEGLFAVLYLVIRVVGGTYVTGRWLYDMLAFYNTTGCAAIGTPSADLANAGYALQRSAAVYFGLLSADDPVLDGVSGVDTTGVSFINPCPPAVFLLVMAFLLSVVQMLQYIWFVQIVRVALGLGERAEPVTTSPVDKSKNAIPSPLKAGHCGGIQRSNSDGPDSIHTKSLHHTNGVDVLGNVPDAGEAMDMTSAIVHDHMHQSS